LVFTMEEVWLERFGGEDSSVHLIDIPETPTAWLNPELSEKWAMIRRLRRVVTAALEVQRTEKVIGASLEAAPVVYLADQAVKDVLEQMPFADICITSDLTLSTDAAPSDAFTMAEVDGIAVSFVKAEGEKCGRCWKILPDVGTHSHVGVCGRCDNALS